MRQEDLAGKSRHCFVPLRSSVMKEKLIGKSCVLKSLSSFSLAIPFGLMKVRPSLQILPCYISHIKGVT